MPSFRTAKGTLGVVALCAVLGTAPAVATEPPDGYAATFVAAFAEACVPQRMSYPGTKATALSAGWTEVGRDAHPELAAVMAKGEAMLEADEDLYPHVESTLYERTLSETPHHLVVTRSELTFGEDVWTHIGCYLYNFDATGPIDPAPVTDLIGKPISHSIDQAGA